MICNCCGSSDIKVSSAGKLSDYPFFARCNSCNATASVNHANKPVGTFADKSTRKLRDIAHKEFDRIWRNSINETSRDDAYEWLAKELMIPLDLCHLSFMGKDALKKVIEVSKKRCEVLHKRRKKEELQKKKFIRKNFKRRKDV